LKSPEGKINNHLLSGERDAVTLRTGDHIFAGAIAAMPLELTVAGPQGQRKIDLWAEAALLSGNRKSTYSELFAKLETVLVVGAFSGALLIAGVSAMKGADLRHVVESFFVGILVFCPCLFASIIPLTKQISHLALLRSGILLSRADALLDLGRVRNFYFDKTGTLEATESTFVSFDGDKMVPLYLKELASKCVHATLRGLNEGEDKSLLWKLEERPGKGVVAWTRDGEQLVVGRLYFLKEMGVEIGKGLDSAFSHVALNKKIAGQIIRKKIYDSKSKYFLKNLLSRVPQAQIEILSGDPAPGAGEAFIGLDERIRFRGNLSPEEKAQALRAPSAFIGDGLNDTLALAKADVSFRIGSRIMGFAPVDFQLQLPNLNLVIVALRYAGKYRRILLQTASAALIYNLTALSLAVFGRFSPLGAVLAMFGSFSLMLLSVSRLSRVKETPR
jgi:cation transport ATPase